MPRFSVVVPAYRTPEAFLRQMIDSVHRQTYGAWELIVADASPAAKRLEKIVLETARDARVRYMPLKKNGGISANTNEAMAVATGDYIVLLDHDDVLTPDALYEFARVILASETPPLLIYSDEDKMEESEKKEMTAQGEATVTQRRYFEPHRKTSFDFEKLLSHNYICHATAIRADIAVRYPMHTAYDGAQDHELFLRIACDALFGGDRVMTPGEAKRLIVHVPRVLYHWRVHAGSTAGNPAHKNYAHAAGSRAIADVMGAHGFTVRVEEMPHRGFFRTTYPAGVFEERTDIGAVGGKITDRDGVTLFGRMDEEGHVFYEGMPPGESGGYQHPAVLIQEAEAVDLRNIAVRDECLTLYADATDGLDFSDDAAVCAASLAFCKGLLAQGYRILYDPENAVRKESFLRAEKESDAEEASQQEIREEMTEEEHGTSGDSDHT